MITSGIYSITNLENGKTYIGSTVDLDGRWKEHRRSLRKGDHYNPYFQRSWNKYGEDTFNFMICEYVSDPEQLISREQYWLDFHRLLVDVYNIALVTEWSVTQAESRRRKSISAKNRLPMPQETKDKISRAHVGYRHTKEARQRMSRSHTGSKMPEEQRNRMIGRALTREHCDSISVVTRGENNPKAIINENLVREIRRRYCTENISTVELGRDMDISYHIIYDVVNYRSWKHVEG